VYTVSLPKTASTDRPNDGRNWLQKLAEKEQAAK
jgi:hypothetical protein